MGRIFYGYEGRFYAIHVTVSVQAILDLDENTFGNRAQDGVNQDESEHSEQQRRSLYNK